MPTLKIRNIHDAFKIVDRYRLNDLPDLRAEGPYGWMWRDFAHWLFVRTNSVDTEELAAHIEAFEEAYAEYDSETRTFSEQLQLNADDIMNGVHIYEQEAHDLMWIIHTLTGTSTGTGTLNYISQAATALCPFVYLARLSKDELAQVDLTLQNIAALGLNDVGPGAYSPGGDPLTDRLMAIDICLLGETLANESLWRDDVDFTWPEEVYAIVRCAQEYVSTPLEFRAQKPANQPPLPELL